MKVTVEVSCCADCPYSSNSIQEHDNPFTSPPDPVWFCNRDGTKTRMEVYIPNPSKIAEKCPERRRYEKT